jgi:NAD(P)H-hydrate epimerase
MADPAIVTTLDADYCRSLLPARDPAGHKFSFGRVVTVCGSLEYAGAAYLTSLAAARGGAGLVAMAVPASLRPALAAKLPEAILLGLPEFAEGEVKVDEALDAIREREPDALVVGPGLKETDDYAALVFKIISQLDFPSVVDAGALNMLAKTDDWWEHTAGPLVVTPHPGEFARLIGWTVGNDDEARLARATAAATQFGCVVVLKGAHTVVANPDGRAAVAPFANAALATAGSGDVLAGLVGALLAQDVPPFDAACLGVYLHGRAGERLSFRMGNAGVLASDIAHEIPPTRHELDAHSV